MPANEQENFRPTYFENHGYRALGEIGRGGYGAVYYVEDLKEPNKFYAIKINFDVVSRPIVFLQASYYYLLEHVKVVPKLHDVFTQNSIVHIVLEYFEHVPYVKFFESTHTFVDVKHYMIELLKGMKVLKNTGIYHRDIKPQNFLYNPKTRRGQIIDFGLAELDKAHFKKVKSSHAKKIKQIPKGQRSSSKEFMELKTNFNLYRQLATATSICGRKKIGTQSYVPLETLVRASGQGYECEIWSAGTILLQFLTQKYHFFNNIYARNGSKQEQYKYISVFVMELANLFGPESVKKALTDSGCSVQIPINIPKANIGDMIALKANKDNEKEQAEDLVVRMLQLRARKRITVEEAIMHPFFDDVRAQHFQSRSDKKWIVQFQERTPVKKEVESVKNQRIKIQGFRLSKRQKETREEKVNSLRKKFPTMSLTEAKKKCGMVDNSDSPALSSGSFGESDLDGSQNLSELNNEEQQFERDLQESLSIKNQKGRKITDTKYQSKRYESSSEKSLFAAPSSRKPHISMQDKPDSKSLTKRKLNANKRALDNQDNSEQLPTLKENSGGLGRSNLQSDVHGLQAQGNNSRINPLLSTEKLILKYSNMKFRTANLSQINDCTQQMVEDPVKHRLLQQPKGLKKERKRHKRQVKRHHLNNNDNQSEQSKKQQQQYKPVEGQIKEGFRRNKLNQKIKQLFSRHLQEQNNADQPDP